LSFALILLWCTKQIRIKTDREIYMNRPEIETKIISPLVGTAIPLPTYATSGSAALDLRACLDQPRTLQPGETVLIPSGIAVSINDPCLMALLVPRSGLGIKHGILLANTVGVIDSDYQGEIGIGIVNRGAVPYTVEPGERICQMMFVPVTQVALKIVAEFSSDTDRGSGGFGSTGSG
jgi:dUTP pyrophosphatase